MKKILSFLRPKAIENNHINVEILLVNNHINVEILNNLKPQLGYLILNWITAKYHLATQKLK